MKILILSLLVSFSAHASFNQNNLRYLLGPEILQSLYDIGIRPVSDGVQCQYFTVENHAALGNNSPATGRAASSGPSVATIDLISTCVTSYFEESSNHIYQESTTDSWVGPTFKKIIVARYGNPPGIPSLLLPWRTIPFEAKTALVAHLVKKILGPDELIEDYGLVTSAEALRQSLQNNIPLKGQETVKDIVRQLTLTLVLRDEFMSY